MNPDPIFRLAVDLSPYEKQSLLTLLQAECDRLREMKEAREKETGEPAAWPVIFVAYDTLRRKISDPGAITLVERRAPVEQLCALCGKTWHPGFCADN